MPVDARRIRDLDLRNLWHPYTRHSALADASFPLIVRGEGVYLYDADGKRYLDAISSWWCCNLGHGHPRLVEAIRRQAGELQHSILGGMSHPRAAELAASLCGLFRGPRRAFFASDGASAVEAALKIALQYWHNVGRPERVRFAALEGGYHGDTLGCVALGYQEAFHAPFKSVLPEVCRAPAPCCSRCAQARLEHECDASCFGPMAQILEEHGPRMAAVIVEPLCQGAAGMRIYRPEYLRRLAATCRERGVLLIADEIAVGFGRTGRMFAFEHAGLDPDIVCVGKALSGGYLPISATVVRESIFEAFGDQPRDGTFYHGHTFAGNPIAAAAALAALDVYRHQKIPDQARTRGKLLAEGFARLRDLPRVRDVRCLGMIAAVELDADADAQRVRDRLLGQGILVRPLGPVVYLMPPLVTPPPVLRELVEALRRAVAGA